MEWEIISTVARLDEVMHRPGHLLEMVVDDPSDLAAACSGAVTCYTGPVPCQYEEPEPFIRVAYVTPRALSEWLGPDGSPQRKQANGPFCSTWVVPGMDIWKRRRSLKVSRCGEFLVDVKAGTITLRASGVPMPIADVYKAAAGPLPRQWAEQQVLSRSLHVLAELLPDDYPVPPPPKMPAPKVLRGSRRKT